jgi:hypothetical protein
MKIQAKINKHLSNEMEDTLNRNLRMVERKEHKCRYELEIGGGGDSKRANLCKVLQMAVCRGEL